MFFKCDYLEFKEHFKEVSLLLVYLKIYTHYLLSKYDQFLLRIL